MKALRALGRVVTGLLRELADESAYRRHLERRRCGHSAGEWQRFHEKRLGAKYSRPKCC